ncbi:MAG: hypothetical protein Kow0089_21320 [Desulfobulbaceae bacterium]
MLGGAVVLVFLVFRFGVFPLLDQRDRLRRGITAREAALVEMRDLQAKYRELYSRANVLQEQLASRQSGFSLFSFLEQMAAKSEVKKNISYMKPSETVDEGPFKEVLVEMKLQAITLRQLVDFLTLVESPENVVAIKRIAIQENKKEEGSLDVILQVVSLDRRTGLEEAGE